MERDGYRGVLITDDGEHDEETGTAMRTKTAGSVRWVPLHAEVAGFWDWAQGREDGPLFPAKANKFGIVSDAFVKWYGSAKASRGRFSWVHGPLFLKAQSWQPGVTRELPSSSQGHVAAADECSHNGEGLGALAAEWSEVLMSLAIADLPTMTAKPTLP